MRNVIAIAAVAAVAGAAQAQILVDDFDGNGQFGSRNITPAGGAPFGSIFDVFGIVDRNINFDFADDSTTFAADSFGVLKSFQTSNVFGVEDLDNSSNPGGTGSVTWTVDITGLTDLSLSIDMGAMGDFESGDNSYGFSVSIDGGTFQNIFSIDADDTIDHNYVLESGTVVNIDDPLVLNGTDIIDNDITTFTGAIAGAGSTLTIQFDAGANNGGSEVFLFDNIVVNGVPTPGAAVLAGVAGLAATRRRRG